MAAEEKQDPPKPRGSCLRKLLSLFTFAAMAGLGVAVFYIVQPQDLSDIKKVTAAPSARPIMAERLKQAINEPERYTSGLSITEEEINQFLEQTLVAKQGGALEKWVTLDSVRVRIEKDRAEIILVRSVFGKPMTTSMYFRVEQIVELNDRPTTLVHRDGGTFFPQIPDTVLAQKVVKGGRFGQLVVPQGFLRALALPPFERLAEVYKTELELAFSQMARIHFEEGKLVLDPRPDGGSALPHAGGSFR